MLEKSNGGNSRIQNVTDKKLPQLPKLAENEKSQQENIARGNLSETTGARNQQKDIVESNNRQTNRENFLLYGFWIVLVLVVCSLFLKKEKSNGGNSRIQNVTDKKLPQLPKLAENEKSQQENIARGNLSETTGARNQQKDIVESNNRQTKDEIEPLNPYSIQPGF